MRAKTQRNATDNQSHRKCFYCKTTSHIARHCKKRINDEKAKAGQRRDNSKGNNTSVKQRVAALETSTSKGQVENASSVPVSSLLTPAQIAATYAPMARQVAATASASAVQREAPDTDSDYGVCMIAEIDEQPTDDVRLRRGTQ